MNDFGANTLDEAELRIERRTLRADIELSPAAARWPDNPA